MILAYDLAYDSSIVHSFIVLATVIMIVNYDHKIFIVQATGNRNSRGRLSTVDPCFVKQQM
jgi:hypothetical protein